jgi:hypothetical protein
MAIRLTTGKPGHGMTFRGAMKPMQGAGNDGRCMLDLVHLVERRCGRLVREDGTWGDAWAVEGKPHDRAEFAGQAADKLRRQGFTVRVRPVFL